MSDGQDKSDDLIGELAKLMASGPGGLEAEAKPAPRLVSTPEAARPITIRIPGMDAPVSAAPTPAAEKPVVADKPAAAAPLPSTPAAASPAPSTPLVRIPGMDRPVSAAPSVAPQSSVRFEPRIPGEPRMAAEPKMAQEPAPAEPRTPSIDFGVMPQPAAPRPQPLSDWQEREVPRPAPPRSAVEAQPKPAEPKVEAAVAPTPEAKSEPRAEPRLTARPEPRLEARTEPRPVAVPPEPLATARPAPSEPLAVPTPPAPEPEPAIAGRPQPDGDSFDFDFGFGNQPQPEAEAEMYAAALAAEPRPVPAPRPVPEARPAAPRQVAASPVARSVTPSTGDPIADLIAADLDAAEPAIVPQPAPRPIEVRPRTSLPTRPVAQQPVARAPAPPPPTEADRFGVAPMFGPAGRAASAQAAPAAAPPIDMPPQVAAAISSLDRDPMDEIESLIGEAVRVELSNDKPAPAPAPQPIKEEPVVTTPAAAPVVPPLTTGFAPRRATLKDTEPRLGSAEAAILAAAAAVEPGKLDARSSSPEAAVPVRPRAKAERRRFLGGGMRQYVGMAVAGTLLLASGFGLYWVLGMNRGSDVDAPVLEADATPVKTTPPAAAASAGTEQGSVVFNEMDGSDKTAVADEQLVNRDASTDTPIADVARTVGDEGAASESELANRRVRTVTVRPDGTIVNGDEAVAGSEALPVDRPNVPDIPGADVQPSELLAAVPTNDPTATPGTAADAAKTVTARPVSPNPADDPVPVSTANIDPTVVAPIPMDRPGDRSKLGGGSNQRVAVAAADPAPLDLVPPADVGTPVAVSDSGGAFVQMSSQRSAAEAKTAMASIQRRLGSVLRGTDLEIRRVDLGSKGIWYRVVAPASSFQNATQLCANIKANGGECVAGNG